jgi:DNA-binding beta-propeller fold protein YncE
MNDISGKGWTAFGASGSGSKHFDGPRGIAIDSKGHIYVVDDGNSRVVRLNDLSGKGWTSVGANGNGKKELNGPHGVALDANGSIYIADYSNNRIVQLRMP